MSYKNQEVYNLQNHTNRKERLGFSRRLRTMRQFSQIAPFIITLLLYFGFLIVGSIFHIQYPIWILDILRLAIVFSVGASGTIILKRGTFVEKSGQIKRGVYAYSIGIAFIIFGFGGTLLGLYNLFIR